MWEEEVIDALSQGVSRADGGPDRKPGDSIFRVGLTADVRAEDGSPRFDIALHLLDEAPGIEWEFLPRDEPQLSAETVAGYDAVMLFSPHVTSDTLVGATDGRLAMIARLGVGLDNIDLSACTEHGVLVTNAPGAVRRPMATSAVAYVLALAHRMMAKDRIARDGDWEAKWEHIGTAVQGRTLGMVGFGNIAHELVTVARPLGMDYLAHDPYADPEVAAKLGVPLVGLPELMAASDFVCVLCALTDETRGLISTPELEQMRSTAYFINLSRGPVVDQEALTRALQAGAIQGAALDVFEDEPPPPDDPLFALDSVIASPHAIGHTDQMFLDTGISACTAVVAISDGSIPGDCVNPAVLDSPAFNAKLARREGAR